MFNSFASTSLSSSAASPPNSTIDSPSPAAGGLLLDCAVLALVLPARFFSQSESKPCISSGFALFALQGDSES